MKKKNYESWKMRKLKSPRPTEVLQNVQVSCFDKYRAHEFFQKLFDMEKLYLFSERRSVEWKFTFGFCIQWKARQEKKWVKGRPEMKKVILSEFCFPVGVILNICLVHRPTSSNIYAIYFLGAFGGFFSPV